MRPVEAVWGTLGLAAAGCLMVSLRQFARRLSTLAVGDRLRAHGPGQVRLTLGQDGIATLVIDNPKKKNAFSGKMMAELNDAINKLESWTEGKAVLLHGAENSGFCSGGDLEFMKKIATVKQGSELSKFMTATLQKLSDLPLISLAFIEAPGAFGGGAEVSIACDFCLMTPDAKIGFIHSKLGIIPAWGGTSFLLDKISRSAALKLVASGQILNAQEAIKVGLVEEIVSDLEDAKDFLNKIACHKPDIIRAAKKAIMAGKDTELQGRLFATLFGADFYKAAASKILKHKY